VKATTFSKLTQNSGHYCHSSLLDLGTICNFPEQEEHILSHTVSKLSWSHYRFDRGCVYLTHLFGINPQACNHKIWGQELQTSLCCMEQNIFQHLEPLRHGLPPWQTDRQTNNNTTV